MTKRKRDELLVIRVAAPLRRELEAMAAEEGRELSDVVRRGLIEMAERRFAEREARAA